MTRMLATAAALSLLMGTTMALAQEHHDEHGGGHPSSGGAPHAPPPAPAARAPQGGPQGGYRPPSEGAPSNALRPQGMAAYPPQGRNGYPGEAFSRAAPGVDYPGRQGAGGPVARGPRPGAEAFAVGGRTFYRYRAAPYAFPGGYGGWNHHYWRRGEFLPSVFFLPNYFIGDYWDYGLWAPDYGYQWIRVGADALLINLATGQVVDVVPGVYYW